METQGSIVDLSARKARELIESLRRTLLVIFELEDFIKNKEFQIMKEVKSRKSSELTDPSTGRVNQEWITLLFEQEALNDHEMQSARAELAEEKITLEQTRSFIKLILAMARNEDE